MKNNNEIAISKTISLLRFPLCVLVVLIHAIITGTVMDNGNTSVDTSLFPVYSISSDFISGILARLAVPLFFLFSGFLFFYNVEDFNKRAYKIKIKKRIKTLFVPYIIWNSFAVILFSLAYLLLPNLVSGENKAVLDFTLQDWISSYWGEGEQFVPADGPLWYVRNLMILSLLSPVIYYFIKYTKAAGIAILGIVWLLVVQPRSIELMMDSAFFFSLGAYFTINKIYPTKISKTFVWVLLAVYFILAYILLSYSKFEYIRYIHHINILLGMACLVSITYLIASKNNNEVSDKTDFLAKSSFFIFAYHSLFIVFVKKILISIIGVDSDLKAMFVYLASAAITVIVGLILYGLLNKFLPKLTSVITGSR